MDKMTTDKIIANPLYDVVFKNLMTTGNDTNRENASFFVGTILGEEIIDIELVPQEYTYHTDPKTRRIMQEEHWAAMNEILWEKQAIEQSNKIAALNSENEELRRLLKQSGIDLPFD